MKSKRALVTGGSRGIGRAISLMLAKNGYNVTVNYRSNDEQALALKEEIEALNGSVECTLLKFDIADFDMTLSKIEENISKNGPFDVLVHNAGIRDDSLLPMMPKDSWDSVIDVNLKSFYYITKPVTKAMFEQKYGKVVIISSTSGQFGMPGQTNYCASKFGVIGAAKALGVELARKNINVNVVAPGYIQTEMVDDITENFSKIKNTVPKRKMGSCEDVANAVEFLISDKADYIVAQVIGVNGGIY